MSRRPSDLAVDTAVTAAGAPGRYVAELSPAWDFASASGGALAAVALRAMAAELGEPAKQPVSMTTVFCSQVAAGRLEVQVELLRRGKAASQLRARLSAAGSAEVGLEVVAVFARELEGPEVEGASFHEVPEPGEAGELADPHPFNPHLRYPFFENFEVRLALGDRWWLPEFRAGPARHARWWRYLAPPRRPDGALDRIAILPVADTMPPAIMQAVGPDQPPFRAPSLDLTIHWLEDTRAEWLLAMSYGRRARAGVATCEVEVWSDERRLVAYGTQMMILRKRSRK